jgi:hypothetical protein
MDQPQEYFYPIPFITPPNLTLNTGNLHGACVLVEQKSTGFKAQIRPGLMMQQGPNRVPVNTLRDVEWRAEGLSTKGK